MKTHGRGKARWMIWIVALALFALHQDFWFWNDASLVLGFLPIGLAYHVGFSLAASLLWLIAVKFAWPTHIEEWAEASAPSASQPQVEVRR